MQDVTSADLTTLKTSATLTPRTLIQVVSRSNSADVRLSLDTASRSYDPERVGLLSGSVNVDTSRDVLRNLSLDLVDHDGDWRPGANRSLWLDAYIQVYRGYEESALWPQGVFIPASPRIGEQKRVSIQGQDKASRANGRPEGGFTTILTISKGTNCKTALEALAGYSTWGETDLNLQATSSVLPYDMTWTLTDYPWDAAGKVASIPGNYRPLHHDETGRLTWIPDPDPTSGSPVWEVWPDGGRPGTALPDEYAAYIAAGLEIDTDELRNWVGVKGGSVQTALYYAEASDSSASSPTGVSRIGYRIYWHNGGRLDPLIATQAEAQARADYELRQRKRWTERIPLTMTELPPLQPWDVIRIINPEMGLSDNYQVTGYSLPLDASGQMTVTGWRVRS
jgi:hypothetical protein